MNPAMLQNASLLSLGMMFLGNDSKYTICLIVIGFLYAKKYELVQLYRDFKNYDFKSVEMEGTIVSEPSEYRSPPRVNFTKSINGILYFLKENSDKKIFNTMKNGTIVNALERGSTADLVSFLPVNNPNGIWITPEIKMIVQIDKPSTIKKEKQRDRDEFAENESPKERTFKLIISSKVLSMIQLYQFIDNCSTQYKEHLDKEMFKPRIFEPCFSPTSDNLDHSGFHIPLDTTKSFDNLYFEGKESLIQRLDSFKDKETYERLGIPDALGLLFYGAPGTGKTSAIKAIAKYMNMSLILVPMNQINSKKRLRKFFQTEHYGSCLEIPYNKRIYVFEEIDASNWGKIIRNRSLKREIEDVSSDSSSKSSGQTIIISSSKDDISKTSKKDEEPLTLGAILETLDGIIETKGRIIIFTTNHRELIDPALLRPGRIDFELEFKKLRRIDVADIYKAMYGFEIPKDVFRRIKDYTYSQAELSILLFKNINDPNGFLREL